MQYNDPLIQNVKRMERIKIELDITQRNDTHNIKYYQ